MSIKHFNIAKGSSAELYTQLLIAEELDYLESNIVLSLIRECEAISGMLHNLIKSRQ